MKIKKILAVLLTAALLCLLASCGGEQMEPAKAAPEPEPIPTAQITLVAVGDDLIHNTIYDQAHDRAGGSGYDFEYVYQDVRPLIEEADLAFVNQETPLATAIAPPSNYPLFNTPTEVGDELVSLGFDVVCHANNHMLDQGAAGLSATLDYWDTQPSVKVIGAYRNTEDLNKIRVAEANGIKVAFVAAAEMTNGMSLPSDSELQYILTSEEDLLQQQITAAKQVGDLVVVSVHWGNEGTHTPTEAQQALAKKMAGWGADVILGHHSHTLQPLEYIEREGQAPTLVIYSLGNFVSGQHGPENLVSGLLRLTIEKDYQNGNKTAVAKAELVPLITQYDSGCKNIRICQFANYTADMAAAHGVHQYDSSFSYDYIINTLTDVIGSEFLSI